MAKALRIDPDIGLREILEISASNQYDVSYSPFLEGPGGQQGGTIIKRAVSWKGATEAELEQINKDVYDGLQTAKDMAEDKKNVEGVAIARVDGNTKIMSKGAAELAEEGQGDGEVIDTYADYGSALDDYAAMGNQAHLPTVY